jgi:hypothetical protein
MEEGRGRERERMRWSPPPEWRAARPIVGGDIFTF